MLLGSSFLVTPIYEKIYSSDIRDGKNYYIKGKRYPLTISFRTVLGDKDKRKDVFSGWCITYKWFLESEKGRKKGRDKGLFTHYVWYDLSRYGVQ